MDTVESFSLMNDRIYATSSVEAAQKAPRVQTGHHSTSVVWCELRGHNRAPFLWKRGENFSPRVPEDSAWETSQESQQHPLPWTELELPAGLSPSTQGADNPGVAGHKCSILHLHFRLAFCKSRLKSLVLQIVVNASGDGLQKETSQYWHFKAVSSEGSCRFSSWCVA